MAHHRRSKPRQCIGRCALQRPRGYESRNSGILCRPHGEEIRRHILYVRHYRRQRCRFRTCPAMVEQGFRKLDPDAHELARQPLDMGSRCYAQQERRQVLLCLLPAVPDTCRLRRNPARPVAQHPRRERGGACPRPIRHQRHHP